MNRLELNWIGKHEKTNKINPEPRIFVENDLLSYGESRENLLIHGDNLLALKALDLEYNGIIKCIYIDPPYNTGSAFEQYDDNLEHSQWLNLMRPRLELLRNFLTEDGSIWISIDDNEQAYLKVLCDEVFGRSNFINCVIWEKKYTISNDTKWLSENHDYILVYAKCKEKWRPNLLPRSDDMNKAYKNPDNHPKGVWKATPLHAKSGSANSASFTYTFKNGVVFTPPAGTFSRYSTESLKQMDNNDEIWFGRDGKSVPSRKTFLCDLKKNGVPSRTLWRFDEVGHNHEAREEVKAFNSMDVFSTPKPERLIHKILTLATVEGDIVLDSFLGSGTTAAVACKMGRKWIGIEFGEHCYTHCYPRLKAVVDGEQGGISKLTNWNGGSGFKVLELAPSLLTKDKFGNYVISEKYNSNMLAAACAKLHGYNYSPDSDVFWKQGISDDRNYIFTTTGVISVEYLDYIASELGKDENLVICAKGFSADSIGRYENIILKQIPKYLLGMCEFGRENYNFDIKRAKLESEEDYDTSD